MKRTYDLIIIGAGVMGLMTAYYASLYTRNIIVLERFTVANKNAGSSGLARSIRSDYLDPFYSRLADESKALWKNLEKKAGIPFYILCGLLNLTKRRVTKLPSGSYAYKSAAANKNVELLKIQELRKRYPQIIADAGSLDPTGGLLLPGPIMKFLRVYLRNKGIVIKENAKETFGFTLDSPTVVAAGSATGELLGLPIQPTRPEPSVFYRPPSDLYTQKRLPVFACLDIGIYGHPIVIGTTKYLKIGIYKPQRYKVNRWNPDSFVNEFFKDGRTFKNVNAPPEQCSYDMTPDEDFIVGKVKKNLYVGAGFCGTGFKFAPVIGRQLAALALNLPPPYIMDKFSPARFTKNLLYSRKDLS